MKLSDPKAPDVRNMSDGELELALANGLHDIEEGRTRDAEEVFADLRGKYGNCNMEAQPKGKSDCEK